jgi:hypothetical protein
LSAQVAYGIPVTSNAVVFIGAKADFGDIKAGFVSPYDFSVSSSSSVYIEPGYSTDGGKSTMYFKLSQNSMTGNYSGDPAKGAKDGSTAFSGLGFGVGFRTMLEGNKFIQLEVNQVNYKESAISDGSLFKPQSTGITLGFGYKF